MMQNEEATSGRNNGQNMAIETTHIGILKFPLVILLIYSWKLQDVRMQCRASDECQFIERICGKLEFSTHKFYFILCYFFPMHSSLITAKIHEIAICEPI